MRKKPYVPGPLYQLKVTLRGIDPLIWRRLVFPGGLSLFRLHMAVQIAIGWDDSHLHSFRIGQQEYTIPDPYSPVRTLNEDDVRLHDLGLRSRSTFEYVYDFGDTWTHTIRVEKLLPRDPAYATPTCLGGKRAGPLEDCGGAWGYAHLLDVFGAPEAERNEDDLELLDRLPEDFDPEHVDMERINARMAAMKWR